MGRGSVIANQAGSSRRGFTLDNMHQCLEGHPCLDGGLHRLHFAAAVMVTGHGVLHRLDGALAVVDGRKRPLPASTVGYRSLDRNTHQLVEHLEDPVKTSDDHLHSGDVGLVIAWCAGVEPLQNLPPLLLLASEGYPLAVIEPEEFLRMVIGRAIDTDQRIRRQRSPIPYDCGHQAPLCVERASTTM